VEDHGIGDHRAVRIVRQLHPVAGAGGHRESAQQRPGVAVLPLVDDDSAAAAIVVDGVGRVGGTATGDDRSPSPEQIAA
jgi:hypothetical protein